jgi:hypothetical protein
MRDVASMKTYPFITLPSPRVRMTDSRILGIFGMRIIVDISPLF